MIAARRPALSQKYSLRKRRETLWGLTFLLPSLSGTAVFVLLPSLDTLRRAFLAPAGGFAWLYNFGTVIQNEAFQMAVINTARFMLICVPLLIVLSLMLALFLSGKQLQSPSLRAGFLMPMAIPVASVALLWQLFFSGNGVLSGYLTQMGVGGRDFINSSSALWVLIGSYIWRNIGYDMVLFLAALSAIPASLYEAAEVDGANGFKKLMYITLPQLKPSLYMVTVLSLLNAFKAFREAYLTAGSYPHESIYMLQHLFNNWFFKLEMDKLCAAAVLTALVICILITILQRGWGRKGETE